MSRWLVLVLAAVLVIRMSLSVGFAAKSRLVAVVGSVRLLTSFAPLQLSVDCDLSTRRT